jgi:hypothetical protein
MRNIDAEIQAVEARIASERDGVAALLDEYGETARDTVTAPKTLLAAAALGFVLGEALRSGRSAAAPRGGLRSGLGALAAGTAMGLIRARYGSPWMLLARPIWSEAKAKPPRPARPIPR